jgi:hypothetical protein
MGVPPRGSVRRRQNSIGILTSRSGCRVPSATGADAVLQRISSGEPMTVKELWQAAEVLGFFARSGRRDVLVARVRVAVRLEELGA